MRWWWTLVLAGATMVGCGAAREPTKPQAKSAMPSASPATTPAGGEARTQASLPNGDAIRRKIIYRATVELVVADFDPIPARIDDLLKQFDAHLAKSTISGTPGSPRTGHWTVRVPAERYEAFLAAARGLGEVSRVSADSQDVTEEFYDVDARIRNKKQEEARLLKLLESATGKLEEVLTVEREISRVRSEVEQLEGRLRVLSDLSALATIELQVQEIKDYVPDEAPTYTTRVGRAFHASLQALISTGQHLSIVLAALAPWLAVLAVPGVPALLWVRARRRAKR